MLAALREFVLVGDGHALSAEPPASQRPHEPRDPGQARKPRVPQLPQLDDSRFGIGAGAKPQTIRRTWLDTFDWRLFRAGLTLELRAGRGTAELILTGRDGQAVATETASQAPASPTPTSPAPASPAPTRPTPSPSDAQLRWPSRIEALPPGPLRELLAPVVGVRALVPVTRAVSVLFELRAVNEDDKTIAMLALDRMTVTRPAPRQSHPSQSRPNPSQSRPNPSQSRPNPSQSHPNPGQPPPRLAIFPLRGYQSQAAKLADALAQSPGVSLASTSPFEAALASAGRRPGDYTGKIDVQLTGSMPAAQALAMVLGRLFDTVEANLPGTISDIDTEFLHDLRVAVRRTRSVLKSGKSVLPDGFLARYQAEFKWLGDLTTPTRDLDVYLLGYPSMVKTLVAATDDDLEPFWQYLVRQRAITYRQLAKGLRSAKFKSVASAWRCDLEQVAAACGRRPRANAFAARKIAKAHEQVLADGAVISQASPPQALHDLRKRCKELRYLLEVFASLHEPAEQWRAVNELKALQDCLGEFQDTDIQLTELRGFGARMMADRSAPAQTLLAMGEIAADLATRQANARGEFAGRFADFASPRGRARMTALTRAREPERERGAA